MKTDEPVPSIGFLTMAFGPKKYIRQADTLALSIKRHMPQFKLAIVTNNAVDNSLYDYVIPMRAFETAGTIHKIDIYDYSPFDETLFIDSDCVVAREFESEFEEIRKYDFSPVVSRYLFHGDHDLWLENVGAAIDRVGGSKFPKFNGGIYFFRRGPFAAEVFRRAREIKERASELGIKSFDSAGPGEETLIGLALSEMRVDYLYDDRGLLMRTPLNSSGTIRMDVLEGKCSFVKEGVLVTPAICHYCGEWIHHSSYRKADYALRHGRNPPLHSQAGFALHTTRRALGRLTRRVRRRLTL